MSRPRKWTLLLAILCFFLPVTAYAAEAPPAIDLAVQVRVSGDARFSGLADLRGASPGVVYDGDLPQELAVRIEFEEGRVRVLNVPYADTGAPGFWSFAGPVPSEEMLNLTGSGAIELLRPGPNATYRVLPLEEGGAEDLDFSLEGSSTFNVAARENWMPGAHRVSFNIGRPLDPYGAAGSLGTTEGNATDVRGESFVFLYGGTFAVDMRGDARREVETGERFNSTRSVADPTGRYGTWWYDRTIIVLESASAKSSFASPSGTVRIAVRNLSGTLDGDLALSGVTGNVSVDGQQLDSSPSLFQTIGTFDADSDYSTGNEASWKLTGPATFVGVDGATVAGDRNAHRWSGTLATVAGLSVLALAAAFFTHIGREFLSFVTGRNVAQPLESTHRLEFLRHIAREPGLTLRDLADRTGLTKWGAMHHVAILKRARYVDEVKSGNVHTYMLNSHSYRFYAPALDASGKVSIADAIAVLNHPTRRLIFEALKRTGPTNYAGLVAVWKETGIGRLPTPRNVSQHASKMLRAGLLARRRDGESVIWSINVDLEEVRRHQSRAFMNEPVTREIVRILKQFPGSDESALAAAARIGRRPLEQIKEKLGLLEKAGLIIREGSGYRLAAAMI